MARVSETNVTDEQAMREMMGLLDEWDAPEPSPWFDGRMMARFREEQQRAPESWLSRVRDHFLFGNTVALKPLMAGAMALLLVAGGGGYLQLEHAQRAMPVQASATVQDLQLIDNNDQAIQQMDQLLDGDDSGQASSL